MAQLDGKKVAILVDDYFEQAELEEPKKALEAAGATVEIVAPEAGEVTGLKHIDKGDTFLVDKTLEETQPDEYDAVVVPGGVVNADTLRMNEAAHTFLKSFDEAGQPMAIICHGPWLLVSSHLAQGRKLTSYFTLQDDSENAGAEWSDQEVVMDGNLITSRNPDDLPAFNNALIDALA